MKKFFENSKPIRILSLSLLLAVSASTTPIMASEASKVPLGTEAPSHMPPKDGEGPRGPHKGCPCKRPFRRFTDAMESLKKEGLVSANDIKTIYDALMKIPPETLEKAEDKDLSAAEALYKDKVLTEEQYKKISDFLKQNPSKK